MIEYRTKPLERHFLLEELSFFCQVLAVAGAADTEVSFGWDSNLDIEEMWQAKPVHLEQVIEIILAAEQAGTVTVGKSDIFVSAAGLELTLCHESDLHIKTSSSAALQFKGRWQDKGFSPYAVQQRT